MDTAAVDAVVDAAADGVALDGLVVERAGEGYRLVVGDDEPEVLEEAELRDRLAASEPYVRNWFFWTHEAPPGEDRRAFLRWVEDAEGRDAAGQYDRLADGVHSEWGQLRIAVRLEDGERRYALGHVEDDGGDVASESAAGERTEYDEPRAMRDVATFDDRGRYRPLKTAPTLRTGWTFPALTADGLVRAVEFCYPATIANWHRERRGELDVDHWTETAARQTGIYDLIEELPREAVECVAEACCVDSQCLKRRQWDYEAGDELDVPRGEGTFPCREPCSLVISAARTWTILEGETERTYELELTPGEYNQLEALVDAVAEGRVDEVREADFDDPVNRYRARYLRAKRFSGDDSPIVEHGEESGAHDRDASDGSSEDGAE